MPRSTTVAPRYPVRTLSVQCPSVNHTSNATPSDYRADRSTDRLRRAQFSGEPPMPGIAAEIVAEIARPRPPEFDVVRVDRRTARAPRPAVPPYSWRARLPRPSQLQRFLDHRRTALVGFFGGTRHLPGAGLNRHAPSSQSPARTHGRRAGRNAVPIGRRRATNAPEPSPRRRSDSSASACAGRNSRALGRRLCVPTR